MMAKVLRLLCACLGVILLVSCGSGFRLSVTDENYYRHDSGESESSIHYSDIVLQSGLKRSKRYLAGEFDDLSIGKTSMAATSNQDSFQDSGGKLPDASADTTTLNNASNKTTETDATRITSMAINENEPKTGGNYLAVQNASIESTTPNVTVTETAQSNTSSDTSVSNSSLVNGAISSSNISTSVKNNSVSLNVSASTVAPTGKNNSTISGDQITIANFSPQDLTEHNITNSQVDNHIYYNSSFISNDEALGKRFWVDMDNSPFVQTNDMLSQSHRRAVTVKLSFDFTFYGHAVRNVTIATGGFLYTGDYVHSWLAATQYIAPLMANFDTSLSNESYVKYMDNGTQFTVQWDKVKLQDRPDSGVFTFQATLRNTGDIIFVYQSVPVAISNITDDNHPVKVGLSDAYIIDRHVLFVRRKTIYEYHRIPLEHLSISNWTVISLIPLPTCVEATSCDSCLSRPVGFDCFWCPETKRCSSGIDRNRQEWLVHDCDRQSISNTSMCPAGKNVTEIERSSTTLPSTPELAVQTEQTVTALLADESRTVSASALLGILFCIGALLSLSFWALYAYRNPHTTSGQFLIKYRPSQWSWKRGQARYTAATIHM